MSRISVISRGVFLLLFPCMFLLLPAVPAESAPLQQYCQYPPYVLQSVLPSVTLLVSNSTSMGNFAYADPDPSVLCDSEANACDGFISTATYYGIFDNNSRYTNNGGSNAGNARSFVLDNTSGQWKGNFLNWLTTRRIDVMKKVLTGGDGKGTEACGSANQLYKTFSDTGRAFTPFDNGANTVVFSHSAACNGASTSVFNVLGERFYNVAITNPGSTTGIIQEMTPKASLGLALYNDADVQGGSLDPQVDGSNLPIAAYRNRIDTPSRFNGMTLGAPLGEALWTIVGSYAKIGASDPNGPRYHNGDYNDGKDSYSFHGAPSRCVKGSVIVISDGEPCGDGSLPTSHSGFNILNFANNTSLNCDGSTCFEAPAFGFSETTIPTCLPDGATAGFEDVALFAHTTDLRGPTFGVNNIQNEQNLNIYVLRTFGQDVSNLLKYGAINGSFDDNNANGMPDPGEYSLGTAYVEAADGYAIERALREIFENLLRRATSGTAASVLASGEGSGANIVQAVFYPRRRFIEQVIEWTGTLNNFWYFVDPFFSFASIREDTGGTAGQTSILNLVTDRTVEFFFDGDRTMANRFSNDPLTGTKYGTETTIPFEEIKPIWEAGKFLHAGDPSSRTIFTAIDNVSHPAHVPFVDGNAPALRTYLAVSTDAEAANIIKYVRGIDDIDGDGLIDFRQRTVPYPTATDNAVWKMGDIINSTPKVASRIPLNTYDKTYNDLTYKTFLDNSVYQNRGMVFAGANDGMLHAFKLGRLDFPGDASWSNPGAWDRARLRKIDPSGPDLGSERWAFIPRNALPYLQAMLDNNYCHLYYVDLAPQLFDASIGSGDTDQSTQPRTATSWRTILIGGMRLGGGCASPASGRPNAVDIPTAGVGYSSYFAIDVTDPEIPRVLWEFSNPALGFATTGPSVVRISTRDVLNDPDRTTNGKWFVVFGSGPTGPITNRQFLGKSDQTLKLFVVDLKTGALERTIDRFNGSAISNAFAGSLINSTADFDLDYQDDAVYLGYVRENLGTWNRGGVLRLQTKESPDPDDWEASHLISNIGPVTSSVARLQNNTLHTNWLFFGTGRYFFSSASSLDDATPQRRLYGVKDPCFLTVSNSIDPACTSSAFEIQLTSADTPPTSEPLRGWFINLDTTVSVDYDGTGNKSYQAERVITDPLATTAGVVFFTTYRPYGDDCAIGGRTFLWAVRYNTGGAPTLALRGRALMQVSTASVEQLDLGTAFSQGDATLNRGGRRSYSIEGVPPTAQGLSLLSPPPPVKRILHMKER